MKRIAFEFVFRHLAARDPLRPRHATQDNDVDANMFISSLRLKPGFVDRDCISQACQLICSGRRGGERHVVVSRNAREGTTALSSTPARGRINAKVGWSWRGGPSRVMSRRLIGYITAAAESGSIHTPPGPPLVIHKATESGPFGCPDQQSNCRHLRLFAAGRCLLVCLPSRRTRWTEEGFVTVYAVVEPKKGGGEAAVGP
jgi:hypothetical protein